MMERSPGAALWNGTGSSETPPPDTVLRAFNVTVLLLTLLLGLPGNVLVCWVVYRNRSLQTANNAPLVNLAASDLLKCVVDIPLFLLAVLGAGARARWCALQQFSYALCSGVQLLTLVSISVERFQAIAFPLRTERTKARIRAWICSIWACGFVLATLSLTLSKRAEVYMMCRPHHAAGYAHDEGAPSDPFGAYVLVPVWGCCLTLIIIHYVRIFRVVRKHSKKVFDSGIQLKPFVAKHVCGWQAEPAGEGPTGSPRRPAGCRVITVSEASSSYAAGSFSESGAPPGNGPKPPEIVGAVCLLTPTARERGKKRMEGKLAQRFGYIIIAFTIFWVPLVVILLLQMGDHADSVLLELETSAVVLTCVPAAVDPLIYTMVTRQFRTEFSKILSSFPGWRGRRR